MFQISITDADRQQRVELIKNTAALVGKGRECAIRITGWRVGQEHARIYRAKSGLFIQDLGQFSGTWVNGARVEQHGPIILSDQVVIGAYTLQVEDLRAAVVEDHHLAHISDAVPAHPSAGVSALVSSGASSSSHVWRRRLHGQLLDAIDLRRRDLMRMEDAQLRVETEALIRELIASEAARSMTADQSFPTRAQSERRSIARHSGDIDRENLVRDVLNEAVGLGPLEELLADDSVTEIMVNRFDEIYVERAGRLSRHPAIFTSDRAVLGVIERIVAPLGRRIDESSPMVDARLKDGSRVNAIIPPVALKGPTLTIRKFARRTLAAEDLIGFDAISADMAKFMRLAVLHRKNIIISGGTGSGKTTLLNVLSNYIPDGERVITIEDAAELRLAHAHLISLEARPANAEGRGQIAIRDLVKNSLRMRPDRIVVGECRGGEALDMLQAMNTGHEGSLTTLHANNPRDALARLETLVLMAGMDLPLPAIRDQVVSAVDIIIQQARMVDGRRVVTSIVEVTGMEANKIQLQELFRYEQQGRDAQGRVQGRFTACDAIPSFYDELREAGIALDLSIFNRQGNP
ncbi:ATPase, T2SS/T4P/T4SS family [Rhodoferax ferrireducens]|uniref:ATPase, T2SS/T4P/T4SS family n=1 Tax=Rhodoferax ferrireducens TaxID=192843 RepID=UPI000E0DB47C|nr:ATPase, T2SS/T4P/T4SS family [Rhodoferax ferrireducens]